MNELIYYGNVIFFMIVEFFFFGIVYVCVNCKDYKIK